MITRNDGTGNTRLNPQAITAHLDYLRIRVKLSPDMLPHFLDFIGGKHIGVLPGTRWSPGAGSVWFDNKIVDCRGINGGYTEDLESEIIDVMIDFSGQYFDSIPVVNQWRLLRGLKYAFCVKCSRIDLAINDYTYAIIPVNQMRQSWYDGDNFGFQSYKRIESGKDPKDMKITDYYGSRNSGKMIRVYDHDDECMRFEAEFKRGYSQLIFDALACLEREWFVADENTKDSCMDAINDWSKSLHCKQSKLLISALVSELHGCNTSFDIALQNIIAGIAVSVIDFRDRSSRKDTSKASYKDTTRLDFYQEFIEKVGVEMRVKVSTKKSSIAKTVAWMQRQVSKSLSIIRDSLGLVGYTEWQSKIIAIGRDKQSSFDSKLIVYIKDNPQVVSLRDY